MEITIDSLAKKMNHTELDVTIRCPEASAIYDVEIYDADQECYDPAVLYIVKGTDLACFASEFPCVNIFRIIDKPGVEEGFLHFKGNLITLKKNLESEVIWQEIQAILDEQKRLTQYYAELYRLLLAGKGLQSILDAGSKMLENPLKLEDAGSKLMSFSNQVMADDALRKILLKDYYLINTNLSECRYRIRRKREQVPKSKVPVYLKDRNGYGSIVSNVMIHQQRVAQLSVMEYERPFVESDREFVACLCEVLSLELQKDQFNYNARGFSYESLILDLIEGKIKDPLIIEERTKACNWDLRSNRYLLTVMAQDDTGSGKLLLIRDKLLKMLENSKSIIYHENIVVLFSPGNKTTLSPEELSGISVLLKSNSLYGGLSRRFQTLNDLANNYKESLKALELGHRLSSRQSVFHYEDYAVYHLLDVCSRQENLKEYCHPSLIRLLEYDKKHHTDYTVSLYVYLKHQRNLKDTAKELHVYPTTLVYRTARIKEIIQKDLNDNEFAFQMLLSFKILELTD